MIRRLYDWTIALAGKPHAETALAAIAFAESSFFPLPPDLILVPMALANPHRAWRYAAICTAASVVGGILGYGIGYFLLETLGRPILQFYNVVDQYHHLKALFDQWGAWIILAKGMTPIPYKLITISAGLFKFDLLTFAVCSIVTRGARFFLVAGLLYWIGEPIREFVEKRLTLVTTVFLVCLVGGFVVVKWLI